MSQPPPGYHQAPQVATVCTWHPERATGLSCSRCDRPACPECLTPASVGFHCRQCVAEARGAMPTARTITGGRHGQQPIVTYLLIGINVLVFLVTLIQGGGEAGLTSTELFDKGALTPIVAASGEWWQFFTSGFLHVSTLHIAMNMLSLYMIGVGLERVLGPLRFTVVYLLSLLGGSAAVYLLGSEISMTAGASGAIFGLLGALAVTLRRLRLDLRQLGVIIALNLVITFTNTSTISWQAHVGGFIVGGLVGAAMVYAPQRTRATWQWGASLAVLVGVIAVIVLRDASIGDWICTGSGCHRAG